MKFMTRVSGTAYVGYIFHTRFFKFSLGSFGALCIISNVDIFKKLLLPRFSSNFNYLLLYFGDLSNGFYAISTKLCDKYGDQGEIQAVTFLRSDKFISFHGTLMNFFLLIQDYVVLEISR